MELPTPTAAAKGITELVYELLDAHGDTLRLADPLSYDPEWEAHLAYLRDLQRVGRERLAWADSAPGGSGAPR
jgi:hypothetical protein